MNKKLTKLMMKKQKGFTLVELMIVLGLITLLSLAGIYFLKPKYDDYKMKISVENDVRMIFDAIKTSHNTNHNYYSFSNGSTQKEIRLNSAEEIMGFSIVNEIGYVDEEDHSKGIKSLINDKQCALITEGGTNYGIKFTYDCSKMSRTWNKKQFNKWQKYVKQYVTQYSPVDTDLNEDSKIVEYDDLILK